MMLAQGYGYSPYRYQRERPYEYDRPYREPFSRGRQDRDIYYPDERKVNRDFDRIERYNWRAPYRPY